MRKYWLVNIVFPSRAPRFQYLEVFHCFSLCLKTIMWQRLNSLSSNAFYWVTAFVQWKIHSSSKPEHIEIPVASILSPESEISGNIVHTTPNSLESALPRIRPELCLADQEVRTTSVLFAEVDKESKKSEEGLELPDVHRSRPKL